jgi:PAS domain S-box-containing protein
MKNIRIMVVEDEMIVAMSLEDDLRQLGYDVCASVDSGKDAILKANETKPDIVLMDVQLKGNMDGIEAATCIHQQLDIPIIFLTAYADTKTLQRAKMASPFGYLLKPFDERELKTTIEMALNKYQRDSLYKEKLTDALIESEERFKLFIESIHDYAMFMLNKDGYVVSWNPGAERVTGYTESEGLGKHLSFIFPPQAIEDGHPQHELDIASKQGRFEGEGWRIRKDGSKFWAHSITNAIKDNEGNLRGFAKITRDITEQKNAQDQIRHLNENLELRVKERTGQLEAANKELEAFSYSVSHDLRAPLRIINGFSRILIDDYSKELPEEARQFIEYIRDNAIQMGRLIDDLLSFSRLSRQQMNIRMVQVNHIIQQALEVLEEEKKDRQVDLSIGDLPPAYVDPSLLKQVFVNLLSNSIKYTKGREVAKIEVGSFKDNLNNVVYYVKDNGVGFNMKYVDKLFGVFQRFHKQEEFEGTGVGLAIVQRIIHRFGGRIWAESEVHKGSTFYFTLQGEQ